MSIRLFSRSARLALTMASLVFVLHNDLIFSIIGS